MNGKKIAIAFATMVLIGTAGAAAQDVAGTLNQVLQPSAPNAEASDTVVEGHTVFTELTVPCEDRYNNTYCDNVTETSRAAAIAIHVQEEFPNGTGSQAFCDVLWFDDSFLHQNRKGAGGSYDGCGQDATPATDVQDLCEGSIWAAEAGDPLDGPTAATLKIKDTYTIESPTWSTLTATWDINKYHDPDGDGFEWAVNVGCNGGVAFETAEFTSSSVTSLATDTGNLSYNALLWFDMADLTHGAPASHGDGGADNHADTTEGNSHPYNPNSQTSGPLHLHNTARVDLYWESGTISPGTTTFSNNLVENSYHDHSYT